MAVMGTAGSSSQGTFQVCLDPSRLANWTTSQGSIKYLCLDQAPGTLGSVNRVLASRWSQSADSCLRPGSTYWCWAESDPAGTIQRPKRTGFKLSLQRKCPVLLPFASEFCIRIVTTILPLSEVMPLNKKRWHINFISLLHLKIFLQLSGSD